MNETPHPLMDGYEPTSPVDWPSAPALRCIQRTPWPSAGPATREEILTVGAAPRPLGSPGSPSPNSPGSPGGGQGEARIGIVIGSARTQAVLLRGGAVISRVVEPTTSQTALEVGRTVAALVARISATPDARQVPISAVGVAVPGTLDVRTGFVISSTELGWRQVDLRAELARHLDVPFAIGHPVGSALLGEHHFGAALGVEDVLFVAIGTGLSAAAMVAGQVAAMSRDGDLGHVQVMSTGPACRCGRRGCLETFASPAGLSRRWREASGEDGDAAVVVARMRAGDSRAQRVWADAVDHLVRALGPAVAMLGSRLLLIGGLGTAGNDLVAPLRQGLAASLLDPAQTLVAASGLGAWSAAIGAACLNSETVHERART